MESIDANHMQMARCQDRSDENYRAIVGVLRQLLRRGLDVDADQSKLVIPVDSDTVQVSKGELES